MKTLIIFGTESGTAELVAEEIAELDLFSEQPQVQDMADTAPDELQQVERLIVICSTYGEGDLPATAEPFVENLRANLPDLAQLEFIAYGLGDSFYHETYNGGIEQMVVELTNLGARQLGETGHYDTSGGDDPVEAAGAWIETTIQDIQLVDSAVLAR